MQQPEKPIIKLVVPKEPESMRQPTILKSHSCNYVIGEKFNPLPSSELLIMCRNWH